MLEGLPLGTILFLGMMGGGLLFCLIITLLGRWK